MNVFGLIFAIILCIGLLAYIGVSIVKIVSDIRARRNLNDEPPVGTSSSENDNSNLEV